MTTPTDEVTPVVAALLANSNDAIVTVNSQGTLKFVSPGASQLFGYDSESTLGRSIFGFLHADDAHKASDLFERRLDYDGNDLGHDIRVQTALGGWISVTATAYALPRSPLGAMAITFRSSERSARYHDSLRRQLVVEEFCVELGSDLLEAVHAAAIFDRIEDAIDEVGLLTGSDVVGVFVEQPDEKKTEPVADWVTPSFAAIPGIERVIPELSATIDAEFAAALDTNEPWNAAAVLAPELQAASFISADFRVGKRRGVIAAVRFQAGVDWSEADGRLIRNVARQFGQALRTAESEELLALTYHDGPIGFSVRTWEGTFVDCNQQFLELQGLTREEAELQTFAEIMHPDEQDTITEQLEQLKAGEISRVQSDCRIIMPSLMTRWVRVNAVRLETSGWAAPLMLMSLEDVTENHAELVELEHSARHDGLTGAANRDTLLDHIDTFVTENDRLPSLIILDVDRFKIINDSLGHDAGDQVLTSLTQRITLKAGALDVVARIGGDEFAIMISSPDPGRAERLAASIRKSMEEPLLIDGRETHQSVSIGVANGHECDDVAELMVHADRAMYAAKAQGRNQHVVFDASMRDEVSGRAAMEHDLKIALAQDQIEVHFQPEFSTEDRSIVGAEALIRWRHPRLGLLPAGHFVKIAEQSGLIDDLGRYALHQACVAFTAATSEACNDDLMLRINISGREFIQPDLAETVQDALRTSGLRPDRLCLEMSESTLMNSPEVALEVLTTLRELGVSFAIDDFGTGHTSLVFLQRFDVCALKIDGRFVDTIDTDPESRAVVETILSLGRTLEIDVIAEGVEHIGQLAVLRDLGCEKAQGFLVSRALSPTQFLSFL